MSSVPFASRHIGPSKEEASEILSSLGFTSMEEFLKSCVPSEIRLERSLNLPPARSEEKALADLSQIVGRSKVLTSCLGMGYSGCHTPAVVRRNILENPGWYTSYTPYQAEISQGRLEAILNFQTMIADLTAMDISNASLLDEATAAAEAMAMAHGIKGGEAIYVGSDCHPQTLAVLRTRAEPLGIRLLTGPADELPAEPVFAVFLQYPATDGVIRNLEPLIERIHEAGALAVVATDLLALTLIKPPGECGADIVVGSAQRFGVPLGFGGPHAAFLATRDEYKRRLPGRLVGVSKDAAGRQALRLTLQTREQHIRRDKATSNICTAQSLLAAMASMYAVYHGPHGLRAIAQRVHALTSRLAASLRNRGFQVHEGPFFDTLRVGLNDGSADELLASAESHGILLRKFDDKTVGIALDETTESLDELLTVFGAQPDSSESPSIDLPSDLKRTSEFLTHPVFHSYHTETELQRYMRRLEARDLSLTTSMIPLGSCTMKLNAASEMLPVTWAEVGGLHPFTPKHLTEGYSLLASQLSDWLSEITGFPGVSLQPNAGSQGEFAGLLAIRGYHQSRGETSRDICLIPTSAHGTNPASAVMAGFWVVPVLCDKQGNIDGADLDKKLASNEGRIGALMITYPSTHGVFEEGIRQICDRVHAAGGQVYMDGANMNAQVGLCRPGDFGADVCHLNLHKTFCIPHGGGGPGVGPVCTASHLSDFLPGHPLESGSPVGPVTSAPLGSASILVISWMYLAMMGPEGLKHATEVAILNANYIAARLKEAFPVLYRGSSGLVAHECILDVREWKKRAGVEVEDLAKRLIDYGFHSPTMSWPVPGTLMIEPTESECKAELDRFCDAMLSIRSELNAIENGQADPENNLLQNAPHTALAVTADTWDHPYSRREAAYPLPHLEKHKFWAPVSRVDNVFGDRNIFCSCPPIEEYAPLSEAVPR